jgi:hypothetical protein
MPPELGVSESALLTDIGGIVESRVLLIQRKAAYPADV